MEMRWEFRLQAVEKIPAKAGTPNIIGEMK
jgi:hypothetical protein